VWRPGQPSTKIFPLDVFSVIAGRARKYFRGNRLIDHWARVLIGEPYTFFLEHRMRLQHMWTMRACLAIFAGLFCAQNATGAPISIGTLAFDELIPGATSVFSISNYTGDPASVGFALPPDFPSLTPVTFTNASLVLVADGGIVTTLDLGDIGPGPLLSTTGDPLLMLQFPVSAALLSARFTATIATGSLALAGASGSLALAGGDTFEPATLSILAELLPGLDPFLVPGAAMTTIDVDGTRVAAVPEPMTATLLLIGGGLAVRRVRRRRMRPQGPPQTTTSLP
jgi:hypothetical protein